MTTSPLRLIFLSTALLCASVPASGCGDNSEKINRSGDANSSADSSDSDTPSPSDSSGTESSANGGEGSGGSPSSEEEPLIVSEMSSAVTRHGITWTFDEERLVGQFVNGDWWVVGPVTVTSITPDSEDGRSGSMLNPELGAENGFDDRIQRMTYLAELDVSRTLPLTVEPGSALVSSLSNDEIDGQDEPYLQQLDVLTVLKEPAAVGDFRPAWLGPEKTPQFNERQLDYSQLGRHSLPGGAGEADFHAATNYFEYPWIEMATNWTGRYYHATKNHPSGAYGREIAQSSASAALLLQLDVPDAEKRDLLIGAVQAGIDIHGAALSGGTWDADGGHNQGRKMLLLLAGKVLGSSSMMELSDASKNLIFQEDQQTFFVSTADVALTNSDAWDTDDRKPAIAYQNEHLGLPEWGIRHSSRPEADNYHWSAIYRSVTGGASAGHFIAARLMGVEDDWNHPAFFSYYERYIAFEGRNAGGGANSINAFALALYDEHLRQCDEGYWFDGETCVDALECAVGALICDGGQSCADNGGPAECLTP